ncbi:TIGR03086 family metal-binding protein [Micromonosporaceae bacterium Da 78-11]
MGTIFPNPLWKCGQEMAYFGRHNDAMTSTANSASHSPVDRAGDPRVTLERAIELAGEVITGVRPEQYDKRTPCPDYDVRQMCNHMLSVLRRISVLGAGGDFMSVPHFADDVVDGEWSTAWVNAGRDVEAVWSDPIILGREIRLPWMSLPGAAFAIWYTSELTLHTWDLAQATEQTPDWDPAVLAVLLGGMKQAMPEQPRGGQVPFGPVVPVPDDAAGIDRLVGWYGRRP